MFDSSYRVRHVLTDDAPGLLLIYAPIVEASHITFEEVVPSEAEMRLRIESGSKKYPWLAAVDDDGTLIGYAYACSWRERQAYHGQWRFRFTSIQTIIGAG